MNDLLLMQKRKTGQSILKTTTKTIKKTSPIANVSSTFKSNFHIKRYFCDGANCKLGKRILEQAQQIERRTDGTKFHADPNLVQRRTTKRIEIRHNKLAPRKLNLKRNKQLKPEKQ
jgi:hypothetical protein